MKSSQALVLVAAATCFLTIACDTTDSFQISNRTDNELVIELRVVDNEGNHLDPQSYVVPSGATIDTRDEESLEGYSGGVLFSQRDSLLICAYLHDELTYSRQFTFDEIKSLDRSLAVTSDDDPLSEEQNEQCS